MTRSSTKPSKAIFQKKRKKDATKVKVTKFATSFYARYGEMMSRLSHE